MHFILIQTLNCLIFKPKENNLIMTNAFKDENPFTKCKFTQACVGSLSLILRKTLEQMSCLIYMYMYFPSYHQAFPNILLQRLALVCGM